MTNNTTEQAPEWFNFAEHIWATNNNNQSKIAYVDDSGALSYGELKASAITLGQTLLDLGVHPEERVLLVMQDNCDWPISFLGCIHAGIIPVAVNTLLTSQDYALMLEDCGAKAILTSAALLPKITEALASVQLNDLPLLVSAAAHEELPANALRYTNLLTNIATSAPAHTHRDDPAFWLYSSGSTGKPKGTVHTHGNLFATNASYARHVLELSPEDVCFSAAKLFFAYGLGNSLTFPLCASASVVLMAERPTPAAVYKRLTEHKVSVFFGVPTLYAGMLAEPDKPTKLSLRVCISAGEALPAELGERFNTSYGVPILDGIGSTEMLHIYLSNRKQGLRYGTSGKPVPGYEVRLINEQGEITSNGEIGELQVRGSSQAIMYWRNREKSRNTFRGEWMLTGDKYSVDKDGWYVYAGRSDDMLKISGQYVSPFEVESLLIEHPKILEAAFIGTTDEDGLTKSKAFVVLIDSKMETPELEKELRNFIKSRLAPHKAPKSIEFVKELPKTPTGKIQRFKLREAESL